MYGQVIGLNAIPVVASAVTPFVLPNTGSNDSVVSMAIAVAIGMFAWGILHSIKSRAN